MKSTSIFIIIALLIWGNLMTTQAQTYDEHDKTALRNFLIQQSAEAGKKNYEQFDLTASDIQDWETAENWVTRLPVLQWNNSTPKRITRISWNQRSLAGSLDLSECVALGTLECLGNSLTSLNFNGCVALKSLDCYDNRLTNINLGKCTSLINLSCYNNKLTSLDVTDCSNLSDLRCYSNLITALDLSKCTPLTYLDCKNNRLTMLNISNCTALERILCQLNRITSMDVSEAKGLKTLDCYNNQLSTLNAKGCTALTRIYSEGNLLTSINVEGCTALDWLQTDANLLTSLDVSTCIALRILYCSGNKLPVLDLDNCPKLAYLNCASNELTALDVNSNTALVSLVCNFNKLDELDVSSLLNLTTFNCAYNHLGALDVRQCTNLADLKAEGQTVTKEKQGSESSTFEIENTIYFNGQCVNEIAGTFATYDSPIITWVNLFTPDTVVTYTFKKITGISGNPFSGTVYLQRATTAHIADNAVDQQSKIWGNNKSICISTTQPQRAYVYSFGGRLIKHQNLSTGENVIQVSEGNYIVKLDDGTTSKCMLKNN